MGILISSLLHDESLICIFTPYLFLGRGMMSWKKRMPLPHRKMVTQNTALLHAPCCSLSHLAQAEFIMNKERAGLRHIGLGQAQYC